MSCSATRRCRARLIFCNRKKDVDIVCASLQRHGFDARALHGDMVQYRRTETLAAFKGGEVNLLVCSDVAGRGLDIEAVSHVINFDVPYNPEDYVHRIGRTGRAGREGRAITLATHEEAEAVDAIAALVNAAIPLTTPEGEPAELDSTPRDRGRPRRGRRRREEPRAAEKRPSRRRTRSAEPAESKPKPKQEKKRAEGSAEANAGRGGRKPAKQSAPQRDDEKVTGLGDHVPAFLSDPSPVPPPGAER